MPSSRIPIDFVGSPARLPKLRKGRIAVLDIAFASGDDLERVTLPFIALAGEQLALWCDHHEHPVGWMKLRADPRFLLVPNREAHACPELITPEVAARVGPLDALMVHGDFDGLLSAVKLLRRGVPPYLEADEDARAIDSPGRGHRLSARGIRLAEAIDEAVNSFTAGERRDFLTALVWSLVEGEEPSELTAQIDQAAERASEAAQEAQELVTNHGAPGPGPLFVVRVEGRRKGRIRKALLRAGEERARIGVVIEHEGEKRWLTAATFDETIDLSRVDELEGGRTDYRYCESTRSLDPVLRKLASLAETF